MLAIECQCSPELACWFVHYIRLVEFNYIYAATGYIGKALFSYKGTFI